MKPVAILPLLTALASASDLLFIGNYGGTIDTASFDPSDLSIKPVSSTNDSHPGPSWQELSPDGKFLYTVEETANGDGVGPDAKGAVSSYEIGKDGSLKKVGTAKGLASPVSLGVSPDGTFIFTANYGTSGCSAYTADPETGALTWLHDWVFNDPPGPRPQQDAPHPHQALFDPTGKYIVVPDLGADLIRIFTQTPDGAEPASQLSTIKTKPGTGPRHAVFYPNEAGTESRYLYVVGEVSNTVTVYSVSYADSAMELTEIQTISTLPADYPDKLAPAAGEIQLSPTKNKDGLHTLYVSNRLDFVFNEGTNSMASYTIDDCSGELQLLEIFDVRVNNTRHFTLHESGEWLVAGGVVSNDVVVLDVDVETGKVGEQLSRFEIDQPVCLTWL